MNDVRGFVPWPERLRFEPQLVRLLALYLTMKVSLVLVGLLASRFVPFDWESYITSSREQAASERF